MYLNLYNDLLTGNKSSGEQLPKPEEGEHCEGEMPSLMREFVCSALTQYNVDTLTATMMALQSVSSAVGTLLSYKQGGYVRHCNLWTAFVSRPGDVEAVRRALGCVFHSFYNMHGYAVIHHPSVRAINPALKSNPHGLFVFPEDLSEFICNPMQRPSGFAGEACATYRKLTALRRAMVVRYPSNPTLTVAGAITTEAMQTALSDADFGVRFLAGAMLRVNVADPDDSNAPVAVSSGRGNLGLQIWSILISSLLLRREPVQMRFTERAQALLHRFAWAMLGACPTDAPDAHRGYVVLLVRALPKIAALTAFVHVVDHEEYTAVCDSAFALKACEIVAALAEGSLPQQRGGEN